jgi:hypothetical protein
MKLVKAASLVGQSIENINEDNQADLPAGGDK